MTGTGKTSNIQEKSSEPGVNYAVDIVGLSKRFRRYTVAGGYTTIKSSLLNMLFGKTSGKPENYTDAIRNLTIRIPRGASFGVIGRNGAGKSTLLKLITGIYKPDSGRVSVNGRMAALIELGAGFHPDFTGRENLYLGGVMHGLSKEEIRKKFDQIVEFAELREVIDDPVKTYSSGMYMRLGFSLAVHTDPDILLVDEVLAVGDAAFVSKCKDKIAELKKAGKTLVLVTHDLDSVERWCDEALWLHDGIAKDRGDPRRVIDHYRQFVEHGEEAQLAADSSVTADKSAKGNEEKERRWGSREIEITGVKLIDRDDNQRHVLHPDDAVAIEIFYRVNHWVKEPVFGIGINRSDGIVVHGTNTDIEKIKLPDLGSSGRVVYKISRLGLADGKYSLDVAVHARDGYPYDYHKNVMTFAVRTKFNYAGMVVPEHTWEIMAGKLEDELSNTVPNGGKESVI
ncbi:MAG: ABC transporter ATP-binding protein [Candidatus Dadabacteria bacterium]|nr:MAG: ABC transporter ATP-binding protein [Candidatus Dadabacteria bacterium]